MPPSREGNAEKRPSIIILDHKSGKLASKGRKVSGLNLRQFRKFHCYVTARQAEQALGALETSVRPLISVDRQGKDIFCSG